MTYYNAASGPSHGHAQLATSAENLVKFRLAVSEIYACDETDMLIAVLRTATGRSNNMLIIIR